jgi:regulator of protease activity HflC (stomatin/prohibitin superfamily)
MKRLLIALIAALGLAACGVVDPGERATFANLGTLAQKCYEPGLYWYNPFTTDMNTIDVKVQAYNVEKLGAASQDLQAIHANVTVNFAINGEKCHVLVQEVGWDFKERVIVPSVSEVLKASTAQYHSSAIIRERTKLKDQIVKGLRDRLNQYHIDVKDVALTNFDFSQEFQASVERSRIAEQRVQQAEFERQQAVKNAEAHVAQAEGQAKANKALAESLKQSPETLRFKELEVLEKKWNGVMPSTILGATSVPMISVK